ncbi:MAG: hypothetical protein KF764_34210 [Labilithrix sp.]|nr:hypothetical protein [Labilithrix sp.]
MSRDPIRLVDDPDPPSAKAEFMRDLIRTQRAVRPPDGKMDELARRLGPILQDGPAATPRSRWLGLTAAAVAAVALVGTTRWVTDPANDAKPSGVPNGALAAPAEGTSPPTATPVEDDATPVAAVSVDALPSVEVRKAPAPAALRCDDVELVDAADTALRAGNPTRALGIAREHEQRCPAGALVQERERIAIEALAELGRSDEARARARAFEERFPSSPHVGRIRQLLERRTR